MMFLCKKVFMFAFVLSVMIASSFNAYAKDDNLARLNDLSERYNLRDISLDEVPEGIIPLVFDSLDELEQALEEHKRNLEYIDDSTLSEHDDEYDNSNFTTVVRESYNKKELWGMVSGTSATLKLYCDYELYSSGSFVGIQGIRQHGWSLSGATLNLEISRPNSYASYRAVNGGEISVSGNVDVDYYLIVNGIVKLRTDAFRAGYVYSFDRGYSDTYFDLVGSRS